MRIGCRWMRVAALGLAASSVAAGDEPNEEPKTQEQAARTEDANEAGQPEAEGGAPPRRKAPDLPLPSLVVPNTETDVDTKTRGGYILRPSTISVMRKEEIQGAGARHPSDLLRLVPGMEVQRVYSMLSNVSVRGFNDSPTTAQGILALIDGRQVYNEFLGNVLWDQLMLIPEDIEEIEVIRGPGSFLYGPNAMHGLVNFVTKSPLEYADSEVSVMGSIGSFDSALTRLRYVKRDKESGSGLIATLVYDDLNKFEPSEADTRDKVYGEVRFEKDLGGGARGNAEASDHRLEVGAGVSDQRFDLLLATLEVVPGSPAIPMDIYATEAQEAYIHGKYTRGGLMAHATWSIFDSTTEGATFYAPFDLDLNTLGLDVHYTFGLLRDHEATVGAGYRYATFETEDLDVSLGRHSTNLVSAFVQDEVTLVPDRLFLTVGVRADHHSEAGTNVAPRAALVWRPRENHSIRASYGRGHRNPSLFENWLVLPLMLPQGTATVLGNRDLKAERMDSFEFGYRGWFSEDKFRLAITAYLNRIDDLVKFQLLTPTSVAPVNLDEFRAYGVEFEAEYSFSESLSGFGNYSYGTLKDRATGTRIRAGPLNKASLGLRYSTYVKGRSGTTVDAMLWLTYFDETEQSFAGGVVDEHVLLNGSISVEFAKGRSAFIKVFNLLDDDHLENPDGHQYGRAVEAGLRIRW